MRRVLAGVFGCALFATSAVAVDITACGQGVPAGQVGVLQNDLDCSGESSDSDGVWVGPGGTFDLNGHTIIGPPFAPSFTGEFRGAIRCRLGRQCRTEGSDIVCRPGTGGCTVTSSTGTGLVIGNNSIVSERHLIISHVDLVGEGFITASSGNLRATDVSVSGGGSLTGSKVFLRDASVDGASNWGIFSEKKVVGTNVTVTNCDLVGIYSRTIKIDGLTATGNGIAPYSQHNGGGVQGGTVRLANSNVTGNVANYPLTATTYSVDIWTIKPPVLATSTCDHSAALNGSGTPTTPWGVCALD